MSQGATQVRPQLSAEAGASRSTLRRNLIAASLFVAAALALAGAAPTVEIAWVLAILLLTIYLFAFEVVEVDVAAVTVLVLLGLTALLAPLMGLEQGLVATTELFDGFASNAVISIIAVMIIGAGLDRTGLMSRLAGLILQVAGTREGRIIPAISGTVAGISSFMQNVGAAALFLPVVSRISARTGIPLARLLMPMGFCAILGGTMTMVGSSPLILLNDLILTSNELLPEERRMETWSLFSVTPIGIALVLTGIVYFVLAGPLVLPAHDSRDLTSGGDVMAYYREVYGLDYDLFEVEIPPDNPLEGRPLDEIERPHRIRVVGVRRAGEDYTRVGPGAIARDTALRAGDLLGILASPEAVQRFAERFRLRVRPSLEAFAEVFDRSRSGIAEVVIPSGSSLIGKSARDVWMRKTYGLALVALHRGGKTLREGEGIRDLPFQAGDTLIVHTTWNALARLEKNRDFVIVTTEYPHEDLRPEKVGWALASFAVALGLVLFTDLPLSVALLTGAMGMVLSRVLTMEEAYKAVSWKTVFLLASLIPLGAAVEGSGAARWIADHVLSIVGHMSAWVVQTAIAALATFFTLVMSNVGATVLLVPLAVNIALGVGADPALFALTVAIATSNSFLIPTHQVNALIMGPAGYRVPDFMRAGGIMTVLFLGVMIGMTNVVYG